MVSSAKTWDALPSELRLTVLDHLAASDVRALASVNQEAHALCVPAIFKRVHIYSTEDLQAFVAHVPAAYGRFVRDLSVCTKFRADEDGFGTPTDDEYDVCANTDAILRLLRSCTHVETLSFTLAGTLDPPAVAPFRALDRLRSLTIKHWGPDEQEPISERLVVAIALAVPHLEQLSLSGIVRSLQNAPELLGVYPYIPVVDDADADLPSEHDLPLSLPSLLSLPHLRSLALRDTHLGDPSWSRVPLAAPLEALSLGSCAHDNPCASQTHAERILANPALAACPTLSDLALATPVVLPPQTPAAPRSRRFPTLAALRIAPHFPTHGPDSAGPLLSTVSSLAASPIERIAVRCFADDVDDVCGAIQAVLERRGAAPRGAFCAPLAQIDVCVVPDEDEGGAEDDDVPVTPALDSDVDADAVRRLWACCGDVRLSGAVGGPPAPAPAKTHADPAPCVRDAECKADFAWPLERDGLSGAVIYTPGFW